MIDTIKNIFKIPELRKRIFFTLGLLVVYRIGGHIPTPGVDVTVMAEFFRGARGSLFGLFDMFVGGAFGKATIFSLGIMPYISASIIMQLLGAVVPYFQKLQKEGEEGRRKITQYTRYGTVLIAAVQSLATAVFLESLNVGGRYVVSNPGVGFKLLTMITFTSGTIFIMWLGEQITEKGIGNGISLIIMIGIIARLPSGLIEEFFRLMRGERYLMQELVLIGVMVSAIAAIVLVTRAQRKIPVQYAKRVIGRKMYGGQSTHIPLSVNTAGIIPIIFAQSIMFAPSTLASFFPNSEFMQSFSVNFRPGSLLYSLIYGLLIIFFAYFYTAIVFNPVDLADNMRKYGGFIPGIRPGKRTSEYIDKVLTRITLPGAIFFALIAILPYFMMSSMNVQFYFGGTGLLIIVGVALDTLQQIESHLMMRHYQGFMKKGKIKVRF
ncbi:MAG: preprotein translocase subunit SecY [candidate division Zixibacteria bacterium SM23_73_2]|nr:MAG: preprotein translocase subunit SecY [candidate division Zixibacteria bacterium SM23_73_2]